MLRTEMKALRINDNRTLLEFPRCPKSQIRGLPRGRSIHFGDILKPHKVRWLKPPLRRLLRVGIAEGGTIFVVLLKTLSYRLSFPN